MNTAERILLVHRAWRYRLRTERPEIALVRALVRAGDVVLDIGAHRGAFTYWMAKAVGSRGLVLAFEPIPELAAYMRLVAADYRDGRIRVFDCALSNREGTAKLHLAGHHLGAATLEAAEDVMGPPITVATLTLDACLSDLDLPNAISLIKCDVEHHELSVFQGAEATLRSHAPVLLFESGNLLNGHPYFEPLFAYLESLGFSGYFFHGSSLVPLERFDATRSSPQRDENQNYVFIHPSRLATHPGLRSILGWSAS